MSKRFSRRAFLGSALTGLAAMSGLAGAAFANPPAVSLRPRARSVDIRRQAAAGVDTLIKASGLSGAVAFAVADAKTGAVLEAFNGGMGLPPASVAKAVTALYALDTLGVNHRFTTSLVATGQVVDGVLKGDLVLLGGGDPTLDTDALASMAVQLKQAGLREVQGRFQVWGGALPYVKTIDASQPDHLGYSPAISGLSLNYNRVHFEWKRDANGYAVAMDARSEKHRPTVTMARINVVNREYPTYTYQDKGQIDQWTVASAALNKYGSRWLPVRKPEKYAGEVFRSLAQSHGIAMKRPEVTGNRPAGQVIVSHKSAKLHNILKAMLKYSTNITAEMVGMSATTARLGGIGSLKASANAMNKWAAGNLGMTRSRLVDHSGLGDASRVDAGELVAALARAQRHKALRPVLKNVVLRHRDGKVNKAHPIKVQAKTGTLNFVSGLAGYMTVKGGNDMVFAIFIADTNARERIKRNQRDRPQGARGWNRKAKRLQQKLIERWGAVYVS